MNRFSWTSLVLIFGFGFLFGQAEPPVSVYSQAANDGTIAEDGAITIAGLDDLAILVGDRDDDVQIMGFLSFDTSSLPDEAIILGVKLVMDRTLILGDDPFAQFGTLWVDAFSGFSGDAAAL